MRYVEFAPRADETRTRLPARVRLGVTRAIHALARDPRPGEPGPSGLRLVAPADSEFPGAIVTITRAAGRHITITYRIRTTEDTLSVLDIREIFVG